jgi:translation initiation factor 1 (eIF-1/SUI1)
MKKEITVRRSQSRTGKPMISIEDVNGFGLGAEFLVDDLRQAAEMLNRIADDIECGDLRHRETREYRTGE